MKTMVVIALLISKHARLLADRIGCLNANLIYALLTCLSSLLVWTFAYDYGTLMAFAVLFGLFGGSFYALCKLHH